MIKNNWVYPVICLVCLNAVIVGRSPGLFACVLLGCLLRVICLRQPTILMIVGAVLGVGVLLFWQARQADRHPPMPSQQVFKVQPDAIRVTGDGVQLMAQGQVDHQFVMGYYRCQTLAEKKAWQAVTQPVLLTGTIDFTRIQGATNRNEFDYARFMGQQKHCYYQATLSDEHHFKCVRPQSFKDWLHYLRQIGISHLRRLPPTLRFHALALLLGAREADGQEYQAVLGRLGIIHLLSLSGLHVYYLVAVLRRGATRMRIPREIVNCGLWGLLPLYAGLVGGGTSISRAIALILLRLGCERLHYQQSRLDSWSIVLLVNLFWQPFLLQSMGGLLSYLMALGLVYLRHHGTLQTSFWLSLLSLPVCLRFNYRWHLLTILINALIAPVFLPVVLTLVLGAILLLPVSQSLIMLGERGLATVYRLLGWIAALPHATITFGKLPLVPLLLIVLGMFWLMDADSLTTKAAKRVYYCVASLYVLSFSWLHFNPIGRVIMFDIGQGDSLLIQQPFNRHNLLIDTGGRLALPQKNWQRTKRISRAEKVTINYLYSCGIDQLDAIAVSHQDADHIGDLGQIMQQVRVKKIIYAAGLPQNQQFQRQVRPFIQSVIIEPHLAGESFKVGRQTFNVLAPVDAGPGGNADSLVLQAEIGGSSWLFTGDLEQSGEKNLMQRYPQLAVDYLKVGHHGSKTASAPAVMQALHLKGALISAGRQNRYGHPHQETLETLKACQVPYWNTAEDGMLTWYYGWGQCSTIKTTLKDRE